MAYTKFLHVFSTKQEHDTARSYGEGGEYHEPWVAYVNDNSKLVTYNKGWDEKYLTFEAIESGTFSFSNSGLSYSIDEGKTWTEIAQDTNTPTINAGDRIMFKGVLNFVDGKFGPMGVGTFSSSNSFNAMGNPYSLLYGDNFVAVSDLTGKSTALDLLFENCSGLISAKNIALPATKLSESCYSKMFRGCTSLTAAPALPATTLADSCYNGMFYGCTSLTTAPVLPATTLANYCYYGMFDSCTSLATAPALPATTLADSCYNDMFYGCTSLTTAPALPAATLSESCYGFMFDGCTALTTAPELPATTLSESCYIYMFEGCTSLTTAPELPATTLASDCYNRMFSGCTSLNYIKAMFTTTPSSNYTYNWVSGVASTGTFIKNSAATWNVTGDDGIPTGWTVETASA